jgi:hypothetical protein
LGIVKHLNTQCNLVQIVLALHRTGGFSRCLNGGKQKADQNSNDGDNNEQLHQRKTYSSSDGSVDCHNQ